MTTTNEYLIMATIFLSSIVFLPYILGIVFFSYLFNGCNSKRLLKKVTDYIGKAEKDYMLRKILYGE